MRRLLAAGIALVVVAGCGQEEERRPAATDRWKPLASSKLARTEVAAARIGRAIYVVGGFEQSSGGRTTAAVERYSIPRNRWTRVRSMPIALNHAAAAAYNGRLYVVGGYAAANGLDDEQRLLLRYDPKTNRWKRLPKPPTARAALAAAVLDDKLYAVGGARDGQALATLEIYDLKRNRWSTGPDMTVAREHLAAAVGNLSVYVVGGRAAGQGNFATVERFDPRGFWERLPDMAKARGGIAAAGVGSDAVVFGGEEEAGTIREVEQFDAAYSEWVVLPNMRTPRHGLGGVAYKRRVYALQGGPQPGLFFSRSLEVLDVP